jgi:hypothetical protein
MHAFLNNADSRSRNLGISGLAFSVVISPWAYSLFVGLPLLSKNSDLTLVSPDKLSPQSYNCRFSVLIALRGSLALTHHHLQIDTQCINP